MEIDPAVFQTVYFDLLADSMLYPTGQAGIKAGQRGSAREQQEALRALKSAVLWCRVVYCGEVRLPGSA